MRRGNEPEEFTMKTNLLMAGAVLSAGLIFSAAAQAGGLGGLGGGIGGALGGGGGGFGGGMNGGMNGSASRFGGATNGSANGSFSGNTDDASRLRHNATHDTHG